MSEPDYTLGPAAESQRPAPDQRRILIPASFLRTSGNVCLVLVILLILSGIALGPMGPSNGGVQNTWTQTARQIGQVMSAYSIDNDQNYPDGNSSTEIFQKLIDENYVNDSTLFYIPLPGKIKPIAGQKLKPENVCFDITSGIDSHAPNGLPLVFMTGYKVTYAPGGSAVPITKPYPQFGYSHIWNHLWFWKESQELYHTRPGIAVFYKGNNAMFLIILSSSANPGGSIPNFVPPDFDPKGKTYRQLTPDGPLPGN